MTLDASETLQRLRAVPNARWVHLKNWYTQEEATTAAATILRLSAESSADIVLVVPPFGNRWGALNLADTMRTASTAPVLGVISSEAYQSAIVMLQGCSVRFACRGTTALPSPGAVEMFTAKATTRSADPASSDRIMAEVDNAIAELIRAYKLGIELLVARSGQAIEEVTRLCASTTLFPDDLLGAGWIDCIIEYADAAAKPPEEPTQGLALLLTAAAAGRSVNVPGDLDDKAAESVLQSLRTLTQQSDAPVALFVAGKAGGLGGAQRIHDLLRLVPVVSVGLVTGEIGPIQAAVVQGCTHRLSRVDAGWELATTTAERPCPSVKMDTSVSLEILRANLLKDIQRKEHAAVALASLIGSRSQRPIDEWVRRLESDTEVFHASTALELGLIDGLVD